MIFRGNCSLCPQFVQPHKRVCSKAIRDCMCRQVTMIIAICAGFHSSGSFVKHFVLSCVNVFFSVLQLSKYFVCQNDFFFFPNEPWRCLSVSIRVFWRQWLLFPPCVSSWVFVFLSLMVLLCCCCCFQSPDTDNLLGPSKDDGALSVTG